MVAQPHKYTKKKKTTKMIFLSGNFVLDELYQIFKKLTQLFFLDGPAGARHLLDAEREKPAKVTQLSPPGRERGPRCGTTFPPPPRPCLSPDFATSLLKQRKLSQEKAAVGRRGRCFYRLV